MGCGKEGDVNDKITSEEEYRGGSYDDVKGKKGRHAHHMPANSISPFSKGKGPCISMDADDHIFTASWGPYTEASDYREQQRELIDNGDFLGAQEMDINDLRTQFGDKYNKAIAEMQDYTKNLLKNF